MEHDDELYDGEERRKNTQVEEIAAAVARELNLRPATKRDGAAKYARWIGLSLLVIVPVGANYIATQNSLAVVNSEISNMRVEIQAMQGSTPQSDTVDAKLADLQNQVAGVRASLEDIKIDVRDMRDNGHPVNLAKR